MREKNDFRRRDFLKSVSLGFGALTLQIAPAATTNARSPQERSLRIVCMGAHPGDPEFGCGGTMAKYSAAGHAVTFLYLTRGEAGDPKKSFSESASIRTAEAERACEILRVTPAFAGQVDANTRLDKEQMEIVSQKISALKPDIVFTHWPLDAHPDHQITGMLGLNAWVKTGKQFVLYFYEVNTGTETMSFEPTDYVDISSVRDQKKNALMAHQTQSPEEVYKKFFKPLEEFRGLEANVPAAEAFIFFGDKTRRLFD